MIVQPSPVLFHLVHGGKIEIEMTPVELADTLRAIDNDGIIGKITDDGDQVWVRGRHIVDVTYPASMNVNWISIRDERATKDSPQQKRTGGMW